MMSIDEQIRVMADQWPGFKLVNRVDRAARWEGKLAPDKRPHLVRVDYRVPLVIEKFDIHDVQPLVTVLNPVLEQHPDYEQGPIPHVYWRRKEPDFPYLCLFSPSLGEWSLSDPLARTTIYWANEWLYFYEGWLITKKWKGGGRHLPGSDAGGKQHDRETV